MTEQTTQAPETQELPKATVKMAERTLVLLAPTVSGKVNGKTVKAECPHRTWQHSSDKAARACARKLAAELGLAL